jgi:hypothetical protein
MKYKHYEKSWHPESSKVSNCVVYEWPDKCDVHASLDPNTQTVYIPWSDAVQFGIRAVL